MGEIRKQYDEDFKKNAVKLSHASPKLIRKIAEDPGIHENILYNADLPPKFVHEQC